MSDMSELWIVCAIVFAGVVLAVHALYRIVSRARRDRNTIKRRLTASAGEGARRTSIEVLRQERGLANFDHPRLAALNEFLAQTGLRISMAHAWTVDTVAERSGRFGAVALSVPSVDGGGDRPHRRLAERRRLSGDRSPAADRRLHRPIAGRAQHHRAQPAHRPPACERDRTGVAGNARSDRGRARHDRRGNCVRSGCHDGRRQPACARRPG